VAKHNCKGISISPIKHPIVCCSFRIVLGSEIDKMNDEALAAIVEQVHVFARVAPAQKNRIILFLPFLPMLPSQILLNNLLYDTSQVDSWMMSS
jgi:hypothetical protein